MCLSSLDFNFVSMVFRSFRWIFSTILRKFLNTLLYILFINVAVHIIYGTQEVCTGL